MKAGMAGVIAAHGCIEEAPQVGDYGRIEIPRYFYCQHDPALCFDSIEEHAAHVTEELTKAGYGNVQEAKEEALTDAADWLLNGEAAGIIAYDGPSNRGEVMGAYDAALEDPESWLRERAAAALTVDPVDLYREERDGMAEA